jgi:hypothetical protein
MIDDYSRVGDDTVFGDALDFVMREKKDSVSTAGNAFLPCARQWSSFDNAGTQSFFKSGSFINLGYFNGLLGDRVHNAVAYFLDVNDVPKTIGGFEKGSRDGAREGAH